MIIALLTSSAKFFPLTMPYSICLSFSPFKFWCYWLINTIQFTNLNNHENDINQAFLVFQEEIFFAAKRCVEFHSQFWYPSKEQTNNYFFKISVNNFLGKGLLCRAASPAGINQKQQVYTWSAPENNASKTLP